MPSRSPVLVDKIKLVRAGTCWPTATHSMSLPGLTQCQIREGETTLWECGGGWADDVDWDKRATKI